MGELAVSATPGEELVTIGLGSCIGVALVDRARSVAALAHVMLPEASAGSARVDAGPSGKFADRAIPALVEAVERHGARRLRLEAVIVGGAQMFEIAVGSALDVGARNVAAVKAALAQARIPLRAEQTGGDRGRTMRVRVAPPAVTVRQAGGSEHELWSGATRAGRSIAGVTET